MNKLSMKYKLLLPAIVSILLTLLVIIGIFYCERQSSIKQEVSHYSTTVTQERKDKLRAVSAVAANGLQQLLQDGALKKAKSILRNMRYDEHNTGYFFLVDESGKFIVHTAKPELENVSGLNIKDKNGLNFITMLHEKAKEGGGFVSYLFSKPNSSHAQPKIAYAAPITGKNGWFIATGVYMDDIDAEVSAYQHKLQQAFYHEIKFFIFAGITVAFLMSLAMLYVASKIVYPIVTMLDSFQEIASGDGDLTLRIDVKGSDEIAQLGNAFNQFIMKLHNIISQVSETSFYIIDNAKLINTQVHQQQSQLQAHNYETEQVVTAVTEMNSSAYEVAQNTTEVVNATLSANQDSKRALELVNISARSLGLLEENILASHANIHSLELQSNKINGVLNVIGDIAEQTNLLALNAAIEAARAGDQGRGFAVVADEVRNLACRTQQSTLEITEMLDELHNRVQQSVASMNESRTSCMETVSTSNKIVEGLDSVGSAVDSIHSMGEQISAATMEQSSVTEEVNRNLVSIKDIIAVILTTTDASSLVSKNLNQSGAKLNTLISQFKL